MRYLVTLQLDTSFPKSMLPEPSDVGQVLANRFPGLRVDVEEYVGPPAFPEGPAPERPFNRCGE